MRLSLGHRAQLPDLRHDAIASRGFARSMGGIASPPPVWPRGICRYASAPVGLCRGSHPRKEMPLPRRQEDRVAGCRSVRRRLAPVLGIPVGCGVCRVRGASAMGLTRIIHEASAAAADPGMYALIPDSRQAPGSPIWARVSRVGRKDHSRPSCNIGVPRCSRNPFQKPSFRVRMPANSINRVIFNPDVYISHIYQNLLRRLRGRISRPKAIYSDYPFCAICGQVSWNGSLTG
jgi:hypothetical protein